MKSLKMRVPTGIAVFCAAAFLLAGCWWEDPVDSLHAAFEKVVDLEKPFQKEQKSLKSLEQTESKLYDKMMKLNMDDFAQVVENTEKALTSADKRERHLKSEKESIDKAKKEFEAHKASVEKIDDQKVRKKAESAASYMEKRYLAYDNLYKSYQNALGLDKELYKLLQNKGAGLNELEAQLNKINKSYDEVLKQNERFNTYTTDYNKAKKDFYRAAGFDVKESR